MGAENSILHDCDWGESYQTEPWEIENGRLANDDEISLFRLRQKDKQKEGLLRALSKQLKSLRHPYILHYVGFEEGSNGPCLITEKVVPLDVLLPKMSSTEIYAGLQNILEGLEFLHDREGSNGPCLITEKVVPLDVLLPKMSSTEIYAGLQNILEAIEFLHDRAKISLNNLHTGCLYVSGDGSWRLGGLEHACQFTAVTQKLLDASKNLREEDTLTPEELEGSLVTDVQYGHARDIYAFAVMTESLLEKLADLGDLTKTFELRIQDECLNKDPKQRPRVVSLLQDRLFSTEFLEVASFLKHVPLKSEIERKEFFKTLLPKLRSLPEELIGQRLVPSLLSRFVMLDPTATECILPSLLVPHSDDDTHNEDDSDAPLLDEKTFKKYVIPRLVRIFAVRDYHIHLHLLKYFPYFVHLMDPETLEYSVFPHVLLGLRDTSNEIAALSLHALAEMVPILGRDIIIGGQSKSFYKNVMPCHKTVSQSPINNIKQNNHIKKGKVLLKDMATHSEIHIEIDKDKDSKVKEKEKKREEMRKRREERKTAREKCKLKNKEIQMSEEDKTITSQSENVISSNTGDIPESQQFHMNQSEENFTSDKKKPLKQSIEGSEEEVDTGSPRLSVQHSDTESFAAETANMKNEWDDWEDEGGNSNDWTGKGGNSIDSAQKGVDSLDWNDKGDNSMESDISDEIEKELQNMSVESESLSASPREEKSTKHSAKKPSKNALKLVPKKTKSVDKKQEVDHNAVISEIEKSVKDYSSTYDRSAITAKTAQHGGKDKDLGSEFEIKNVDVKVQPVAENPFDFFADMAPKIESKNVSDVLKDAGRNLDESVTDVSVSKVSFEVMGSTVEETEDGGGWGEDDW